MKFINSHSQSPTRFHSTQSHFRDRRCRSTLDLQRQVRLHTLSHDDSQYQRLAKAIPTSLRVRLSPRLPVIHHAKPFSNLNPGGWMEIADITFPVLCDDDSLAPDSALLRWTKMILECGHKIGRLCNSGVFYKEQMEAAGFENVAESVFKWPGNRWPRDKYYKELGQSSSDK